MWDLLQNNLLSFSETINMIDREKKCVCIKRLRVIMIVLSLLPASLSLSLALTLSFARSLSP